MEEAKNMAKEELVNELIEVSTKLGAARIAINVDYSKAEMDQERAEKLKTEILSRMSK